MFAARISPASGSPRASLARVGGQAGTERPTSPMSTRAVGLALFAAMVSLALSRPSLHGFLPILAAGAALIVRDLWTGESGGVWIAITMPTFSSVAGLGFDAVNRFTPVTFDALLARMDLGIAAWVRSTAIRIGALSPLTAVYMALPEALMLAVVFARKGEQRRFLWSAAIGLVLCPIWYLILPAVGPVHIGDPHAPRNCMPSMHLTWALLIWRSQRGPARYLAGAFVIATALATLATGEHYTPDLVAALPWAWVLDRIAGKRSN
jgi:PAP2 superfamily